MPQPLAIGASLYRYLEERGMSVVRALQHFRAVNAGAEIARLMGIAPRAALLVITRIGYCVGPARDRTDGHLLPRRLLRLRRGAASIAPVQARMTKPEKKREDKDAGRSWSACSQQGATGFQPHHASRFTENFMLKGNILTPDGWIHGAIRFENGRVTALEGERADPSTNGDDTSCPASSTCTCTAAAGAT